MSSHSDFDAEVILNKRNRIDDLTPPRAPDRTPHEKPQAYIITGQPAAGKSTTQNRIFSALPEDSVASYDSDENNTIHPQYVELMQDHGKDGDDVVSEQLTATGHQYHKEYMQHLRGETGGPQYDVVTSHPFGRAEWADGWVDGFAGQGYETSVAFVATHESNSRLGISHRYQKDLDNPDLSYGRWVDPNLHDEFYANGPEVAYHLESNAKADHIYVVNRNGEILHENHRNPDGTMENALGARDAIITERNRAPTPQEEEQFNRTVEYMRSTDPRIHPETVDSAILSVVDTAVAQREQLRSQGESTEASGPGKIYIDDALLSRSQTGSTKNIPNTQESTTKSSTPTPDHPSSGSGQTQPAPGKDQTRKGTPKESQSLTNLKRLAQPQSKSQGTSADPQSPKSLKRIAQSRSQSQGTSRKNVESEEKGFDLDN